MTRRKIAFFLAVYFLLASFSPFSHCHAIEESHPGFYYHAEAVSHKDHDHSHDGSHQPKRTCCSEDRDDDANGHHHFLAEYFHYFSDRKKYLVPQTPSNPGLYATHAALVPNQITVSPIGFSSHDGTRWWLPTHFFKRVSGISPPDIPIVA